MTRSQGPPGGAMDRPPSPSGSNRSSESEGTPVRRKLKETRIDAQASSDPARASDRTMQDAPNGAASGQSRSGSENRIGRKRSREHMEDGETSKRERHTRKKSRDITSPHPIDDIVADAAMKNPVARIDEHEGDETMTSSDKPSQPEDPVSQGPATPAVGASDKEVKGVTPPHKRTHAEVEGGDDGELKEAGESTGDGKAAASKEEEPVSKRPREKSASSGFANTSTASPFATISSQPKPTPGTEKSSRDLPQTSDEKFKSSGFGSFASSTASPFGAMGGSASPSIFAAKPAPSTLSSFASPTKSTTPAPSGFGSLGSSSASGFGSGLASSAGGSVFGGSLGQAGFGGLGGAKSGLLSFASPGASTIVGLSKKPARPFGAAGHAEKEGSGDEEEGGSDDDEGASDNEEGTKGKQTEQTKRGNLTPQEIETGEEGEETLWTGRAKLFTFEKSWKEAGMGPFKFNVTKDEPKKARFILRADGTHRLLLNAAVTKTFKFGTSAGERSTDGKLYFSTPTADGKLELHLLKVKAERGAELCDEVERVKEEIL